MDTLETIYTRRSIRKYLAKPVEPEKIDTLLKAAMYAPSAMNEQPWRFIVIADRNLFGKIMQVHPYAAMLNTAPLAILVCGDLNLEQIPGNWVLDCSNATQNLLLAAHATGLGAVWCGVYPEQGRMGALADMFHLPRKVVPFALVAVGYADVNPPAPPERFNLERVCLNDWNSPYRI
ncbi:MAG: nitroreductase family protein [Geobacter sp.]|nr:MAG: nitroreductase family protein [Geobacter sp.]